MPLYSQQRSRRSGHISSALDPLEIISALRPVTREQVEKVWRGEWERIIDPCGELEGFLCKCGRQSYSADNFCPSCGMAMSDKAVELVLKRLEVLKDET